MTVLIYVKNLQKFKFLYMQFNISLANLFIIPPPVTDIGLGVFSGC